MRTFMVVPDYPQINPRHIKEKRVYYFMGACCHYVQLIKDAIGCYAFKEGTLQKEGMP